MIIFFLLLTVLLSFSKRSMIWICGNPCGEDKEVLDQYVAVLKKNHRAITDLSYELFEVGPKSTILGLPKIVDLTKDLVDIQGAEGKRVNLFPMIVSFSIERMREMFSDPTPFINQAIGLLEKNPDYSGFNIDFEPPANVTEKDRGDFVIFLDLFSNALKKVNKEVSVDIATWSIFWDQKKIAESNITWEITMETYAKTYSLFEKELKEAYESISQEKLGAGLASYEHITEEDMKKRFSLMKEYKVEFISVWRMMFPAFSSGSFWWELMKDFLED